jgi:hypothetical protein
MISYDIQKIDLDEAGEIIFDFFDNEVRIAEIILPASGDETIVALKKLAFKEFQKAFPNFAKLKFEEVKMRSQS